VWHHDKQQKIEQRDCEKCSISAIRVIIAIVVVMFIIVVITIVITTIIIAAAVSFSCHVFILDKTTATTQQ
jgi:uncharacterized membrane protein